MSKTKISKRTKNKTNPELVGTIILAKKSNLDLAKILSGPTKSLSPINLDKINEESKDKETIIVPGKVLGQGEIDKKIKIIALSFSASALEKLKKGKTEFSTIKEELEKNNKIQGRILK